VSNSNVVEFQAELPEPTTVLLVVYDTTLHDQLSSITRCDGSSEYHSMLPTNDEPSRHQKLDDNNRRRRELSTIHRIDGLTVAVTVPSGL